MTANRWLLLVILLTTALVCCAYRSVTSADFVWLDKVCFGDPAWFLYANDWTTLLSHNFYGWINYFRPVVIAFFALEIHAFDVAAGPMHAVSLALHLLNTSLVGAVALSLLKQRENVISPLFLVALATLFYGLHPASIEPVAWISCQFELLVSFFMLAAIYLNYKIKAQFIRAAGVGILFFFAACCKESAVSLPPAIFLLDWMRSRKIGVRATLIELWRAQWMVYTALFLAGVLYLVARHASLGTLVNPTRDSSLLTLQRLQEVAAAYVIYLRVIAWPMLGLGPLHTIDINIFTLVSFKSFAIDLLGLSIFVGAVVFTIRKTAAGAIVMAATIALLPVLHIVPITFDESFYHDRYALFAIGLVAIFLPSLLNDLYRVSSLAMTRWSISIACIFWLLLAIANIAVTLPLWANDLTLWQWMKREHPTSIVVDDHLLSTYIENGDYEKARNLADRLVETKTNCVNCLLNAAELALVEHDADRATTALDEVSSSNLLTHDRKGVQRFVLAKGRLLALEGQMSDAEEALRAAIQLDGTDPLARFELALLLARSNRRDDAARALQEALPLFPAKERAGRAAEFQSALTSPISP